MAAEPGVPELGPPVDLGVIPNGDLATGLEGWGRVGPSMVLGGGPTVEAADNTSILTPVFTVPPGGQSLPIRLGVPGANAVVQVRARPVEGGPDIPLATIVPERAVRRWDVGLGAVRGRTIRVVIDPITSMGRRLYVASVGPVQAILPGWDVAVGLPVISTAWGRRAIVAGDGPVSLTTPPIPSAAGTRFIGLAVRGEGRVRAVAAGRAVTASPRGRDWMALRIPVRGGKPVSLAITATPEPGKRLVLSDVGVPVTAVRLSAVSVRRVGGGAIVTARVSPNPRGVRAEVRVGTRLLGRGTATADGGLVVRVRTGGTSARLVILDDARHIGTSVPLSLPG